MVDHIINVQVDDKIATVVGDPLYVCGNSDYIVRFAFDAEWADHDAKTARFVKSNKAYVDVPFTGDQCAVPILENTLQVRIGVYAGNLCTTTPAIVNAQRSILCGSGTPADPPDDVYARLMTMLNELAQSGIKGDTGESAYEIAIRLGLTSLSEAEWTERLNAVNDLIGTNSTTVKNSDKLGGNAPEYYLRPKDHMTNGNFANPVNQRGKTTYQFDNGYTIDRWRLRSSGDGSVEVRNGCIRLYRASNNAYLFQHMEHATEMVGKTYTVAAKVRYQGVIGWIDDTQRTQVTYNSDEWGIVTKTFTVGAATCSFGNSAVELRNVSGQTFDVAWVALYEGSYTADTLPPYVPKEYAVELAECMRFLQVFGDNIVFSGCVNGGATSINFTIPHKTDFRARPSVDISGITSFFLKAATTGAAVTIEDDTLYHNAASTKYSVTLSLNNPDKTKYPAHSNISVNIGGKLALSAELNA